MRGTVWRSRGAGRPGQRLQLGARRQSTGYADAGVRSATEHSLASAEARTEYQGVSNAASPSEHLFAASGVSDQSRLFVSSARVPKLRTRMDPMVVRAAYGPCPTDSQSDFH